MPSVILSMDDALSPGLAGVLFGSSGAFLGALEAGPLDTPGGPTLTYGIAAPHLNANGSDRRGTFYALIPGSILGLFGTSTGAFNPDILAVDRTNGAGTFSVGGRHGRPRVTAPRARSSRSATSRSPRRSST